MSGYQPLGGFWMAVCAWVVLVIVIVKIYFE